MKNKPLKQKLKEFLCNHFYALEHNWSGEEVRKVCVKCGKTK